MTPAERLLERLENVRPNGKSRWTARCPSHADKTSSLSIRAGDDDAVLLHCFAGCATTDVLASVGLELRDLFPTREKSFRPVQTESQRLEREFKREHPNADASFYRHWLELRVSGWQETGLQPSGPVVPWASPILPDLPAVVLEHFKVRKFFKPGTFTLENDRQAFKALTAWIAACVALETAHATTEHRRAA